MGSGTFSGSWEGRLVTHNAYAWVFTQLNAISPLSRITLEGLVNVYDLDNEEETLTSPNEPVNFS